jgi:integrase
MLTVHKRGKTWHADLLIGRIHPVRGTLGTRNEDAARRLKHKLEIALAEGSESTLWHELRTLLPRGTFTRFAVFAGVKEQPLPTWSDLRKLFTVFAAQRVKLGKLAESTVERYEHTFTEFDLFLSERKTSFLREISVPLVEEFKIWRIERIKTRKHSRGATGAVLDVAILHRIFAFAVKRELIQKNPVQMEGRPGDNPEGGAEPFTANELSLLRKHADQDLLSFLVLRWTGFRGSDAVALSFLEVHFSTKEIERLTRKRKKKVVLPLHPELLFALETEQDSRKPQPIDRVLANPVTGQPLTRPRLYQRMVALGRRAGVSNVHPHRFRDTFAVDLLLRGASPYDVAKMLGDTIETVEKHYMPFVRELRERVRRILENGAGLEEIAAMAAENTQNDVKKPNEERRRQT